MRSDGGGSVWSEWTDRTFSSTNILILIGIFEKEQMTQIMAILCISYYRVHQKKSLLRRCVIFNHKDVTIGSGVDQNKKSQTKERERDTDTDKQIQVDR